MIELRLLAVTDSTLDRGKDGSGTKMRYLVLTKNDGWRICTWHGGNYNNVNGDGSYSTAGDVTIAFFLPDENQPL